MKKVYRKISVAFISTMLCAAVLTGAALGTALEPSKGQEMFETQKCNLCHSVSTVKIEAKTKAEALKGPDLVGIGEKYEVEWITNYLKKEVKLNDNLHKTSFKGSDEELQVIIDWLLEQKSQ